MLKVGKSQATQDKLISFSELLLSELSCVHRIESFPGDLDGEGARRNRNFHHHHITGLYSAAAAKLLQSCPTLCDPLDGSPPGSPIPAILQARTLEWVAISFSNA